MVTVLDKPERVKEVDRSDMLTEATCSAIWLKLPTIAEMP